MSHPTLHPLPIAVFAHNEERNIIACLNSLRQATSVPTECYVLANGCSDHTEDIVRKYQRYYPGVRLVCTKLGDKANAWNMFIHEAAPCNADYYFFIDGDVRASPWSLDVMIRALAHNRRANGVSALPASGRDVLAFQRDIRKQNGLAGNLYGLRGSFVNRIREQRIVMPVGTIGEDALVGAMLKWDLRGDTRWDNDKVTVADGAGFEFDSVSYWRPREWRKYLRRRVRYGIRGYQNRILGRAIQPAGFLALPRDVRNLYARYPDLLKLQWAGLRTIFDWLALREIKATVLSRQCDEPARRHTG